MKALVYHGPGSRVWEDVPDPAIHDPEDAIVRGVKPGDRVLISCISACGRCRYCREGHYGQCLGGDGWILGHRIDGTQAEKVRIPFADRSLHLLPDEVTDESLHHPGR